MNSDFTQKLFDLYPCYFEGSLSRKRFTHGRIMTLVEKSAGSGKFKVNSAGFSIEERQIFTLEYGRGDTVILLWSQMHGDEPTATMSLFDILNFLSSDDELNWFRESLKNNLRLVFLPMLNPDGAERITRQNAIGIDLNRDAFRLESPESKILMNLVDEYRPDFAFNLHDQDFRWSVGSTNKLAAISLLAPVYDYAKSIDHSRSRAIKLVADLRSEFEGYLPGQIGRYKDDFEPRSFGDTISGKNVSTILIETGRDIKDPDKLFHRKIMFMMLLSAFGKIISKEYINRKEDEYFDIPLNGNFMFDLILRNVCINFNDSVYTVDIAINREEVYEDNSRIPSFRSRIMEIGDLSPLFGIEEFDCFGFDIEIGNVTEIENNQEIPQKLGINIPADFVLKRNGKPVKRVVNGSFREP